MPEAAAGARWARLHWFLAALVCVVIPAQSWLDGSGARAWTMYARSASYRVRIVAIDSGGNSHWMSPSELASRSTGDLKSALAGSEAFRVGPQGFALRSHIEKLAEFACDASGGARATVIVSVRERAGDPVEDTVERRECTRR